MRGTLRRCRDGAGAFPSFEFAEFSVVPAVDFDLGRKSEFIVLTPALDRALRDAPALRLLPAGEESFGWFVIVVLPTNCFETRRTTDSGDEISRHELNSSRRGILALVQELFGLASRSLHVHHADRSSYMR